MYVYDMHKITKSTHLHMTNMHFRDSLAHNPVENNNVCYLSVCALLEQTRYNVVLISEVLLDGFCYLLTKTGAIVTPCFQSMC